MLSLPSQANFLGLRFQPSYRISLLLPLCLIHGVSSVYSIFGSYQYHFHNTFVNHPQLYTFRFVIPVVGMPNVLTKIGISKVRMYLDYCRRLLGHYFHLRFRNSIKEEPCFIYKRMYPICIPCRKAREYDDLLLAQNGKSKTEAST